MWTAFFHFREGILAWVIPDHSAETFKPLWDIVRLWGCYFYVTDGWPVYATFIDPGDHIISKTYMTRIEGENTRLRQQLAHRYTYPNYVTIHSIEVTTMSSSMMQSNFLVDLSVEQEETIAGGLSIGSVDGGINLDNLVKTHFSEQKLATVSTVKSGRDGGEVTRIVGASDTNSYASELFKINV